MEYNLQNEEFLKTLDDLFQQLKAGDLTLSEVTNSLFRYYETVHKYLDYTDERISNICVTPYTKLNSFTLYVGDFIEKYSPFLTHEPIPEYMIRPEDANIDQRLWEARQASRETWQDGDSLELAGIVLPPETAIDYAVAKLMEIRNDLDKVSNKLSKGGLAYDDEITEAKSLLLDLVLELMPKAKFYQEALKEDDGTQSD